MPKVTLARGSRRGRATPTITITEFGCCHHHRSEVQEAARVFAKRIEIVYASDEHELEVAFQKLVGLRAGGVAVGADPYFSTHREKMVALAARHAMPTIYE